MALLFGTESGIYRTPDVEFDDATKALDAGRVMRVRRFGGSDGTFACTKTGLYRSMDGGETWTGLGVPREEVYAACTSPNGDRLYAGTHPAHLYVSVNSGDSWRELEGLQELPSRDDWYTPRHRNEAHIRSLDTHPDAPHRVIAGVEVGGVHLSEDEGVTWTERRDGVHDDVHHVLVLGSAEYIASCGDGLYRTRDAGHSWMRLDGDLSRRYFREAIVHDGRLYAAAARSSPGTWSGDSGADAALFVSDDDGGTFSTPDYPGKPREVVLAWAVADDRVVAGTNDGRALVESNGEWETVGRLPSAIRSLCAT
ncbi:MAG: WD40/YVTN/BNR-like repeat-containing protein [Haloferacaceae archaeon]